MLRVPFILRKLIQTDHIDVSTPLEYWIRHKSDGSATSGSSATTCTVLLPIEILYLCMASWSSNEALVLRWDVYG